MRIQAVYTGEKPFPATEPAGLGLPFLRRRHRLAFVFFSGDKLHFFAGRFISNF